MAGNYFRGCDLFGDPIALPRGRGRPRHIPTERTRALVRQLRADGLNQGAIAQALGITIPTLLLNYPAELGSKSQTGARRAVRDGVKT
jgi:hypothetical protein